MGRASASLQTNTARLFRPCDHSLRVGGSSRNSMVETVTAQRLCAELFPARPARKTRNQIHAAPANQLRVSTLEMASFRLRDFHFACVRTRQRNKRTHQQRRLAGILQAEHGDVHLGGRERELLSPSLPFSSASNSQSLLRTWLDHGLA